MSRRTKIGALALLVGVLMAANAQSAPSLNIAQCLELTRTKALGSAQILRNLGLTPDQIRELRGRLSQYNSISGFKGLDGIGLTPEQKAEIESRIAVQVEAMYRHPIGWPCKPFQNPGRVIAFVKAKLIANGYRPAMSWRKKSPRQFQFTAIQDGIEQFGVVAKSGPRQIAVSVQSVSPRWGRTYRFTLTFEA